MFNKIKERLKRAGHNIVYNAIEEYYKQASSLRDLESQQLVNDLRDCFGGAKKWDQKFILMK